MLILMTTKMWYHLIFACYICVTVLTPVTATNQNITSQNHNSSEYFAEDASPAPLGQCGIHHIVVKEFVHRVFLGNNTNIGEFPWMALLRYKSADGSMKFKCGGALINRRYVLTAAHCLASEHLGGKLTLSTVRLGEHDTSNDSERDCENGTKLCADMPQEIPVASTYTHPKYNFQNRLHDIAILKLAKRAVYTDYVQPICLARRKRKFIDGEVMYLSGWGRTLTERSSPVKQKINLPIVNKKKCVEVYKRKPKTAFLIPSQICAGGVHKQDGCDGDSGGPLMKETPEGIWEAVGVSTFSRGCGLDGYPGIYTSVAHYYSWIISTLYSANQK